MVPCCELPSVEGSAVMGAGSYRNPVLTLSNVFTLGGEEW